MSREQNLQVVQRGYEAFGQGDIPGLLAILADDIEWTTPGPAELPIAGTRHGVPQVAKFFTTLNEVFQFEGFEPQAFMADGDRVAVFGTSTVRIPLERHADAGHAVGALVSVSEREGDALSGVLRRISVRCRVAGRSSAGVRCRPAL